MEDGNEDVEYAAEEEEDAGGEEQSPPQKLQQKKKKPCNQRIEQLSTPNKRMFLALWNEHGHHLPKDKVKNLKLVLQQLYAMSPEETAQYFAELREQAKAAAARRKLKQKLRKYLLDKHNQKQRQKAYKLFKKLLKCGITYAVQNPVPPIISIRLRYLSDIILEQLCELRKVDYPNRENPDQFGRFLISVADWMAIAVERLYFAAQISINEMMNQEQIEEPIQQLQKHEFRVCSSQPQRRSLKSQEPIFDLPSQFSHLSEPIAASTPKRLSLDSQNRTEDPYYSILESEPVASSNKKKPNQTTPYYSLKHLQSTINPKLLNKTHLEIPPYVSSKLSKNTTGFETSNRKRKNKSKR